jgi:hypothetical protein
MAGLGVKIINENDSAFGWGQKPEPNVLLMD